MRFRNLALDFDGTSQVRKREDDNRLQKSAGVSGAISAAIRERHGAEEAFVR